jgi:DNA-binding CsgD family transcriptional regulator
VLLARRSEQELLDGVLSKALGGESGALVVRGEPGIGKSALLGYAIANATAMRVLVAAGVESESEVPFSGLSQLLHPVVDLLKRIPARQGDALAGALALGPPSPGDPFTIYAGSLSLLTSAAEESPILAVLDDAHWLDASSQAAIAFTARRLHAERIALLVASREAEDVFRSSGLPEITLHGLDRDAAAALVARTTGKVIPASVLERIHAATAGNPLALAEIPALLSDGQLMAREPLGEPIPVTRAIERAFLQQLESVSRDAQAALVVAAASESGEIGEIQGACHRLGLDPELLEAGEEAGLVRLDAEVLRFRHPLLRAVVYQSASAPLRRGAHAALAETIDDERRAWHLAAAASGPDEAVARTLEDAALTARRRGGVGEAARTFERAAQLSPAGERRVERLIEAGGGFLLAGQLDRGLARLDDALATTSDVRVRAEIHHLRGRGRMFAGAPMEAHALLTTEAAHIAALDPDKAALMLVDAVFACFTGVRPTLALESAERAYELARGGSGTALVAATVRLADALVFSGEDERARPLLAWSQAQLEETNVLASSELSASRAYALMVIEDFTAAREQLTRVVTAARSASAPAALPLALAFFSELGFRTGHWTQAATDAFEAARLAEETGQISLLGYALSCRARMDAAYGREAEFERNITSALALGERFGIDSLHLLAGSGHALLSLPVGRSDEVIRQLEPVARLVAEAGGIDPGISPWQADLIEALIHAGRHVEAEAELAKLEHMTARSRRPGMLAVSARCRGLLASEEEFEDELAVALRWHEQTAVPFERARTELALGIRRRRVGRRLQAREPLRAALECFDRLGARRWAQLARAELRATGEAVRPRDQTIVEELTAQELQVALAVGGGATNREAAEALFLSPKTIEYHLGHVYRKLGVRSRTELARLLAREGAGRGIAGLAVAGSAPAEAS